MQNNIIFLIKGITFVIFWKGIEQMSEFENGSTLEQRIMEQNAWLHEAVQVVTGQENSNPLEVFLPPTEVRDDVLKLDINSDQEVKLREIAGRFGIGSEMDIPSGADYDVLEGGKPWKILAEANIASGVKVFAGSAHRKIGEDEKTFLVESYGIEVKDLADMTEFDMTAFLASKSEGFVHEELQDTGFGYEITEGNRNVAKANGQLLRVGNIDGQAVYVLRVDREDYVDEAGKNKYRNQPDGARLLGFISDWLSTKGDDSSVIGLNTSNTYASRALDVVKAGQEAGRAFTVGMYGRNNLRKIAEDRVPEQTPINQIPGELYVIASKLKDLEEVIRS